jgi:hypothetical protein
VRGADEAGAVTSTNGSTPPPAPGTSRPTKGGRIAVRVVVVALVGMWVYVLYLAFGPGRADPPEKLHDPQFARAAQQICNAALDEVAKLPPAFTSKTAADRAVVLAQANADFARMLDRLDAIVPPGDDGTLTKEWLADWRTYLGNREDYATALRTDPKARLLVSPKKGGQITEYLDAFAGDNDMPACSTPGDAG